ncbi:MAG: hypothetical protein K2M85_03185, partial [Paramuribaculum sp.]|nr:hypothetical protein [Paramuribaculum sp.]
RWSKLTETFIPPLLMKQRPFLLYYFVYCNYFNVLYSLLSKMHSTILSAEMFCKVKANFSNYQIFREKFLIFFEAARLFSRSFASLSASAVVSFSKASAKLQHFPETTKHFA